MAHFYLGSNRAQAKNLATTIHIFHTNSYSLEQKRKKTCISPQKAVPLQQKYMTIMKKIKIDIYSKTLGMWMLGIGCGAMAVSIVMMILIFAGWIDYSISEPGKDMTSNPWFDTRLEILFTTMILLMAALLALIIYNFVLLRAINHKVVPSILRGEAIKHEAEIVALLKSVAQPLPGKSTFNTARVSQFMRALSELGLIDSNIPPQTMKLWLEDVTSYSGDTTGHINAAYKKTSIHDEKVRDLSYQIEKIIAS